MKIETGTPEALTASRLLQSRARASLYNLLGAGILVKPRRCEQCNKRRKLEGHHADYRAPERVEWLCLSCHRSLHGSLDRQVQEALGDKRAEANRRRAVQYKARMRGAGK